MNLVSDFILKNLSELIADGGVPVDEKVFLKRKSICEACPYFGQVTPVPGISVKGCTLCGCPLQVKARMEKIQRLVDKGDTPLTPMELAQKATGLGEFELVFITCPHPEGNKWA